MIYKNNDPSTKNPKYKKVDRYMNFLAHIWHNQNETDGSGIRKDNEN